MSSTLLVDISSVADGSDAGASFAQVPNLVDTVTVGSTSSVILMIAVMPSDISGSNTEWTHEIQFAVGGVVQGPINCAFKDNTNEGCSTSLCWALTGISGSTQFSLFWRIRAGTPDISTSHIRSLRVIEIENATILVNQTSVASDSAVNTYTDIVGLSDTQTVTASSLHILLGNCQLDDADTFCAISYRFDIDNTGLGPEPFGHVDSTDDLCGNSLIWATTGLSGSTEFALQWEELVPEVTADTGITRSFQVIEVTQDFNLQFNGTSVTSYTHTSGYTDITDLVATGIELDGTGSVLLFAAVSTPAYGSDNTHTTRFYDGTSGFGGEVQDFIDSINEGCGHSNYMASTGLSGTHTFSLREDEIGGAATQSALLLRGMCIVELEATPAGGANPKGPLGMPLYGALAGPIL